MLPRGRRQRPPLPAPLVPPERGSLGQGRVLGGGAEGGPGAAAVGQEAGLPVGQGHLLGGGGGRRARGPQVGAEERVRLGRRHDQTRREGGPPGAAALGEGQRGVRLGRVVLHVGRRRGGAGGAAVLLGERVPLEQDGVRRRGAGGAPRRARVSSIEGASFVFRLSSWFFRTIESVELRVNFVGNGLETNQKFVCLLSAVWL